jgi:hypothetical protein
MGCRAVHQDDLGAGDLHARIRNVRVVVGALHVQDLRPRQGDGVQVHRLLGTAQLVANEHQAGRKRLHVPSIPETRDARSSAASTTAALDEEREPGVSRLLVLCAEAVAQIARETLCAQRWDEVAEFRLRRWACPINTRCRRGRDDCCPTTN